MSKAKEPRTLAPLLILCVDIPRLLREGELRLKCLVDTDLEPNGVTDLYNGIVHARPSFLSSEGVEATFVDDDDGGTPKLFIDVLDGDVDEPFFVRECSVRTKADFEKEIMLLLITRFAPVKNEQFGFPNLKLRRTVHVPSLRSYVDHPYAPIVEISNMERRGRTCPRGFIGIVQPNPHSEHELLELIRYLFDWFVANTRDALDSQKRRLHYDIFGVK